jgi:hypothetical protein
MCAFEGDRVRERTQIHVLEGGRRVAVLAGVPEVGLARRLVALGAVIYQFLVCGMATCARERGMCAFEGDRVVDSARLNVNILEPFGRVAVLADVPEVGLAGRLVALGAVVGQFPARGMATGACQVRVGTLQGHRVFETRYIDFVKPFGRVAVLAEVPKVGLAGRLVA